MSVWKSIIFVVKDTRVMLERRHADTKLFAKKKVGKTPF